MSSAKFQQALHQLRFAAGLQWNFQAAQRGKLYVEVAYSARTTPNPLQHFEQFLLVATIRGDQF
jgi:hypothetical protein